MAQQAFPVTNENFSDGTVRRAWLLKLLSEFPAGLTAHQLTAMGSDRCPEVSRLSSAIEPARKLFLVTSQDRTHKLGWKGRKYLRELEDQGFEFSEEEEPDDASPLVCGSMAREKGRVVHSIAVDGQAVHGLTSVFSLAHMDFPCGTWQRWAD